MGLKENIKAVKEEISTEEQFLEGMIKGERFFKKNKKYIISLLAILVIGGSGYAMNDMIHQSNLSASNIAYQTLLQDANNTKAREILQQKNPKLYMLYEFSQAVQKNDIETLKRLSSLKDDPNISDLATYQVSQLEKGDLSKSELFSGLVLLEEGYGLLKEGKIDEARLKFAQIEVNSPLKQIAKNLEHYQGLK
ncbi:MAG: hypothetical protein PHR87_06310 [Sulfurospirillaceae bacterium]|nr:hypothetical protein [Sulfurospirillaceae bacterium]